ncbi:MAG: helicase-related protein, partial [Candidatus Parvarchaeum sp.]
QKRNEFIAEEIIKRKDICKKVIVFVSTNKHVKDLYEVIRKKNKFYGNPYKHTGFIFENNKNEKNLQNEKYLKWHKTLGSSILVNCKLLNEGYDDPKIDTIVMATPTKSILYFTQCVGRAIRGSENKKAYVLDIVDALPNYIYRIDNRWLFGDISDCLEPIVIEEKYESSEELARKLEDIAIKNNLNETYAKRLKNLKVYDEFSVLLFCSDPKITEKTVWLPLAITPDNKNKYIDKFNMLQNNIEMYGKLNQRQVLFKKLKFEENDEYFSDRAFCDDLFSALKTAFWEVKSRKKVERLKYYIFVKSKDYMERENLEDIEKFQKLKLIPIRGVKPENLLLDPNNPRFSKHSEDKTPLSRYDDPDIQEETANKLLKYFDVEELEDSIKARGYVPVDNIFIKKYDSKDKFIVIEGNRRVTAIKQLLKKNKANKSKKDVLESWVLDTLEKLDCYDLTNNSQEEVDFILGLRHHGSLMSWEPLPAAFNIYERYFDYLAKDLGKNKNELNDDNFIYDASLAKEIAKLYSLRLVDVRDKLRTYRAYLQLKELTHDPELEGKFSIIHDAIKDPDLKTWFKFDDNKCVFDEDGAEIFIGLICKKNGKNPIITSAAAGERNLRDLAYVKSEGTEEDLRRIVDEGEAASAVRSDVRSRLNERNLSDGLEEALRELGRIRLENIKSTGLSNTETRLITEIKEKLDQIQRAAKK